MKPIARVSLWATFTFLIAVLVAGAIGVYGFDVYERAWGRGPSFQVMTWVAVPMAILVGVIAALGSWLSKCELRMPRAVGGVIGSVAALALVISEVILPGNSELRGLFSTFALLLLVLVVAMLAPRFLSRGSHVS